MVPYLPPESAKSALRDGEESFPRRPQHIVYSTRASCVVAWLVGCDL